ncbi:hypothetical protein [Rhodanobacter thiooxydans]|uniref:hypothetical protein n=1 Tax=Rhodanobacter thiooxydans TaxID=416169 RepID=UPI000260DA1C|nr:hypothetical protein [Rhodanobacter thiooxydans]EIL99109.1 hypothetical protein UUA_08886 [Rhodanobacter thiooxydans LCS2]
MDDIKQQVAITALNKMMSQGHFSICTIDQIAKMLDITPDPEAYAVLRPLHCIDYATMPRDLYARLPDLIQAALSGQKVFQFELRSPPATQLVLIQGPAKPKLLQRLFHHG